MATYKPYRKTASGKEEIKIPYSVLSNPPAIPTSINGLTGGTVNGNITLTKQLVFNDTSNPFIQMQSSGNTYYFQAYDGKFGLGASWGKATKFDENGNVEFAARPKVGTASVALQSDIPDVSGKQDKLTAGSNISISGNTISATVPTKTSQLTNDSNYVKSNVGAFTGNVTADNFNSRFSLQSVPYGTAIGANADLNTTTYLKVGNYYCSADNTVATQTNVPTNRAYMMTVYSPLGTHNIDQEATATWVYRVRKLMTYTGDEYIQYVYSGSTAGSFTYIGWQQIAKKSDIPTVNNGTLTIKKNGTTVATFGANQSGNATANITVPTMTLSGTTLYITL